MMSRSARITAAHCLMVSVLAIVLVASAPIIFSWSLQSAVEADDVPALLVSRQLRQSQGLSIGDVVSLSSDPAGAHPRQFRIAGEYEPVPDPMRLGAVNNEVRLHLPDLIEMTSAADPLAEESVDAINVGLGEKSG